MNEVCCIVACLSKDCIEGLGFSKTKHALQSCLCVHEVVQVDHLKDVEHHFLCISRDNDGE